MNKAQFKIQQMVFMLIAIVMLFIIIILFYISIQSRRLNKQANILRENQAIVISEFIAGSPEFSCGAYCVDTDKIMFLMNRSVYDEFWPVSYIKLVKTSGKDLETTCNFGNYPDCGVYNIYKNDKIESSSSVGSFVALCRYELISDYPSRICELGKIIIGYDVK